MKSFDFEIVVVGAGPAGIAAACVAAEAGKRVAVLDNTPWLGGQIWRSELAQPTSRLAQSWLSRLRGCGAQVFGETTVFGASSPRVLQAESPRDVFEFGWNKLILATGARELFLPFPGWTLPGVVGAGGLHALAKNGWPVAGKRVVVAGSGPLLLAAAEGLRKHGARIRLIAEQAPLARVLRFGLGLVRYPGKLMQGINIQSHLMGVRYRWGCWPVKAEGPGQVQGVTFTDGTRTWAEECDYLACGFHLVPNLELPLLLGCAVEEGVVKVNELQETSVRDVFCAGEPTGIGGADCALIEGQTAGLAAAGRIEEARALSERRCYWHQFSTTLNAAFALRPELRHIATADTIVCRCEDVRRGQLECDGDWREAKLHTRCGMGTCQGRTCGGAARFLFNWENDSMRPPIYPVALGSLVHSGMPREHHQTINK